MVATTTGVTPADRRGHNRVRLGRPSELLTVVARRTSDDGSVVDVTRKDRVLETVALGGSIEDAAARAGIATKTLYDWQRRAARLMADLLGGVRTDQDLTDEEAEYVDFLQAVEQARADGKLLLLGLNDRLARGGIPITTVTEKRDSSGNLVERVTRTETTLPDGAAIRWRLERSFPQEFGRRVVEVTGPDGGPVQLSTADRASDLADSLRAYQLGRADKEAEIVEEQARGKARRR